MREPLRIKQILTIPDGFTVLTPVEEQDGKVTMEDCTKEGWSHVIALVDGGEWEDDYVSIYEIDHLGYGEISNSARLIRRQICPNCGSEMTPHMSPDTGESLKYTCNCGCMSAAYLNKGR